MKKGDGSGASDLVSGCSVVEESAEVSSVRVYQQFGRRDALQTLVGWVTAALQLRTDSNYAEK